MTLIATLVSSPANPQVSVARVAQATALLGSNGHRILNPGVAVEMDVGHDIDPAEAERRLRETFADVALDLAVLPADDRAKRLLVADMDSTMIGQECIDELAAYAGLKEHVAAITERAMRGEIAFEPALRERVALLKGLPISIVDEVLAERITLTPGGIELIRTMRANGAYCALVSGGFTVFTSRIRAMIGFNEDRSNTLLTEAGHLIGEVADPILGKEAKLASLIELRDRLALPHSATIAIGDGANDLAMIEESGLGIAYHAKPKVAAEARVRIDHSDLTAVLYFQGFAVGEFVRG
ncbi:phosphoserine phosphatase SerB [Oryzibacter oryziterrae]|uniref:phosphoserine phosphatase SerB n=1 Tax=Oryzibacter oryziterrae TaxID=2766474 RepID=UPI001F00C33A|nr:phosphoserine phosphatase SerB [Oryzibacter oryziterrae]